MRNSLGKSFRFTNDLNLLNVLIFYLFGNNSNFASLRLTAQSTYK